MPKGGQLFWGSLSGEGLALDWVSGWWCGNLPPGSPGLKPKPEPSSPAPPLAAASTKGLLKTVNSVRSMVNWKRKATTSINLRKASTHSAPPPTPPQCIPIGDYPPPPQ